MVLKDYVVEIQISIFKTRTHLFNCNYSVDDFKKNFKNWCIETNFVTVVDDLFNYCFVTFKIKNVQYNGIIRYEGYSGLKVLVININLSTFL